MLDIGLLPEVSKWLKEQNLPSNEAVYFSLDDLCFTTNSLSDIIDIFYKNGGKNKSNKQIAEIPNSYLVKDTIEYAHLNQLPLWIFGMMY